jgi:hypothetical protein
MDDYDFRNFVYEIDATINGHLQSHIDHFLDPEKPVEDPRTFVVNPPDHGDVISYKKKKLYVTDMLPIALKYDLNKAEYDAAIEYAYDYQKGLEAMLKKDGIELWETEQEKPYVDNRFRKRFTDGLALLTGTLLGITAGYLFGMDDPSPQWTQEIIGGTLGFASAAGYLTYERIRNKRFIAENSAPVDIGSDDYFKTIMKNFERKMKSTE